MERDVVRSIRRASVCVAALALACLPRRPAQVDQAGLGAWCQPSLDRAGLVPGEALPARSGQAQILGGPFSYDECEEERIEVAGGNGRARCSASRENRKPERYGAFTDPP